MIKLAMREIKILEGCRSFLFVGVLITGLFFSCVRSEVYTVGDDEGWISDSNYDSWSRKYNFSVGDVLVFKYVKGQHNVYEVMEGTYRSCDVSRGVIEKYESGKDEVRLTQQKKYWFICNVAGHCLGGMRFNIDVKASTSVPVPVPDTNSTSSPPTEQPPPPHSPAFSISFDRWTFLLYLLAFLNLFNL
ncbi:chemocyanin [Ricinus communis]|uniref:Blue copper protein, putative n=1 Tax=Ricinus communis TaxID=3988 RepID=B9S5L2_RICCO|nr:chemocyanin [Ricinus communis]EEF41137.1 Blue copper protein precursor, putative [Ricinus communis]|eukprot:XP_002521281.3 chemocyanin [Ricinus communis]